MGELRALLNRAEECDRVTALFACVRRELCLAQLVVAWVAKLTS